MLVFSPKLVSEFVCAHKLVCVLVCALKLVSALACALVWAPKFRGYYAPPPLYRKALHKGYLGLWPSNYFSTGFGPCLDGTAEFFL